ncbi:unnamed protein product [Thelazia callipaeda]|uniref:PHD-type domain-containing protein n=1 Tax=Thelazia callipaeda TaxID=103827 RepID=A0A158RC90_THECL|nr:unnamed protein product [Thelazia callipaeda]
MATATTALVRTPNNSGRTIMMMPAAGAAIATSCANQPQQASLYPSQQNSPYLSQPGIAITSANGRLFSNHSCGSTSANFYSQQAQSNYPLQHQQQHQQQRSFYQNLTPEPQATTANSLAAQAMSCEAIGSTSSSTISSDNGAASALSDLNSQSLSVRRPSSCSSRSRPSSACSSVANVQMSITSTTVSSTTTSIAMPVANMNGLANTLNARITASPVTPNNTDVLIIRDPFEEDEFSSARCSSTVTQIMFNQRPPQYINTGNPLDSGGQLELPRHLRVPYPESAYRACAAANKNLATYRNGAPLPPFMLPYPACPGPRPASLFAPSIVPIDNSLIYANSQQRQQQQQLPGNATNFGIFRNSKPQASSSPGCPSLSMPNVPAGTPTPTHGFGNPYCIQAPTPTHMMGPPGCIQRPEYLSSASGPYCISGGAGGQPYFGNQPVARPEPGTANMIPINGGLPSMNLMTMVNMNNERMGPAMGMMGAGQQPNTGSATAKKGNAKRSKASKSFGGMPNLTNDEQQLLAARRKQQPLVQTGQQQQQQQQQKQQQQPMMSGMMLPMPVSSQDFYMSQNVCGNSSGMLSLVQPPTPQQQSVLPLSTGAPTGAGTGGMGQFDHFDARPSTSLNCTPMPNSCPSMVQAVSGAGTPPQQQQSTSQMIVNSMMMTRGYGTFEQNGFVDGFQAPQSNGSSGSASNNNIQGNSNNTITTSVSGDSFTVLNGSLNNRSTNHGSKQRCVSCTEEVRGERPGIQCTANGEGCRRFFHQECSGLLPDAFRAIIAEPRAEWICPDCLCRQQTQITFA